MYEKAWQFEKFPMLFLCFGVWLKLLKMLMYGKEARNRK